VKAVIDDFIEIGIDALNPLEAKAGLDAVELRREYGHRIAFCGNMNVQEWERASEEELERIVARKLEAGRGGGLIFQSDHSVPTSVSRRRYELVLELVRRLGTYPLSPGAE